MMNIFLYSHNPLHHALVGAIGALITYLIYWGISLLIAFIRGRKGKNEDTIEMNQNKGIVSEAKESTNDMKSNSKALNNFCLVFFVSIAFSLIPANFISSIVSERINNSKHLMRITKLVNGVSG